MTDITIAIDAMGGDHGAHVVVPACVKIINRFTNIKLILVGNEEEIEKNLVRFKHFNREQIEIVHASEIVGMDELPSLALRCKKDSSMRVAINLVKQGRADACVSAGNTGALMATARFVLKTISGIDRPAIIAEFPCVGNRCTRVLDLGANVDVTSDNLFQFAVMGSALIEAVDGIQNPRIGLLNIGVEEIKGNDQVKRTQQLLSQCDILNYTGYVEGDQLFTGAVDLIVCDGFVGNVALKVIEGTIKLFADGLKHTLHQGLMAKTCGILFKPFLKKFKNKFDPMRYNGAIMLGLNGIVVKSHGGADELAFESAIEKAIIQVEKNVVQLVKEQIANFINQGLML